MKLRSRRNRKRRVHKWIVKRGGRKGTMRKVWSKTWSVGSTGETAIGAITTYWRATH